MLGAERRGRSVVLCRPPPPRKKKLMRASSEEGFLWVKVRKRWKEWKCSGATERVLRWVSRGVPCYWKAGAPAPWNMGQSMMDASPAEVDWVEREASRCVNSGAWREVNSLQYCSRVFLVPKPGLDSEGRVKYRLIIDLRPLNMHCVDFKTKYETLAKLGTLISEGETVSFMSFDLADAYNCLQIDEKYQNFFGFNLRGRQFLMTVVQW